MIDRVIAFSIRNRSLVILAGFALALWGIYAVYHTPMDAVPDLSENQIIVFTEWAGHSPREIEDQITYPLSLHLQGLAGVRVVRSSSDVNFSMVNVIFEEGIDFYFARQQVGERLERARSASAFPAGATPHLGPDAVATGQIFWYTVEGKGYNLGRLRAVQDWYVRYQLQSVPGVAEVASVGGYPLEYQIEVDPNRLRTSGATLEQLLQAVAQTNATVGGHVIQQGNAEYLVRGVGWLGASTAGDEADTRRIVHDLETAVLPAAHGAVVHVGDVATVAAGPQFRRGVLEKDGNEVVGGVVLMRYGENPLAVTRRITQKILELQAGLPDGVRIVPFYDRTPLIEGAVGTVTGTVMEAMITATICVVLVLLHLRTSLIIAVTLPLAALCSFIIMWLLRAFGVADIQTNIMSLAGIAISIGVLVDSSIVMAENVMHTLTDHFGDRPIRGDVRPMVLAACRTVGRPIFFSVLIMLLSFLPLFALGGIEGKMFHPLAFTKSFALLSVGVLAITLVPALCTIFIRGRLRRETDNWLVRSVIDVYRPVLAYLFDHPAPLVWFLGITFLVGVAPVGNRWLFLATLFVFLLLCMAVPRGRWGKIGATATLLLVALLADQHIQPLEREFITRLDEGMIMDMPITIPRASVTQSGDDLKARDMIFCRFPEVDMVVGKAGRAETPTDPAPLDMIETMINFRPVEFWPKRHLCAADAERQAAAILEALAKRDVIAPMAQDERRALVNEATMAVLPRFDALMREFAYQRNQEFQRELGPHVLQAITMKTGELLNANGTLLKAFTSGDAALLGSAVRRDQPQDFFEVNGLRDEPTIEDVTRLARKYVLKLVDLGYVAPGTDMLAYRPGPLERPLLGLHQMLGGAPPSFFSKLHDAALAEYRVRWRDHVKQVNGELEDRGAALYTRLALEELLDRTTIRDEKLAAGLDDLKRLRLQPAASAGAGAEHHHSAGSAAPPPSWGPFPVLDAIQDETTRQFAKRFFLWRKDRAELADFGGELDRIMQMPGWTNVWTMPIQNRVDMLATGVNTSIGIRVLGRRLEDVVQASEDIALVVKRLPGAADVVADPVRGKGYVEIDVDRAKAAGFGLTVDDVNTVIETALGGRVVTQTVEGRERHPVRVRFARSWRDSVDAVKRLLVPVRAERFLAQGCRDVALAQVADIRVTEGPATIKSENGLLRNYVRLNARGRDAADLVEEARRVVASEVRLPAGVYLEWTGQFEHEIRARQTLLLIVPLVVGLIFLILYWTYHDLADAVLMVLAVPGCIVGGIIFQWLFGYKFSVTVWVGYIACFGMATATGIIMLVYLREAVAKAGGLAKVSLQQLRVAVMDGAVHRLRPKLLTEATTIIGLAPMLWASGVGAEVIKPMAAPVIGGLLIADEIIDLLLPVLFYAVRRRRWMRLHASAPASNNGAPAAGRECTAVC